MKTTHLARRPPRGQRFAWGRVPAPDSERPGVQYRLFLRDSTGRSFAEMRTFYAEQVRPEVAAHVRAMRQQLRWCVKQVDAARQAMQ